jgi:antibiotic biosynthesis monooxygenase (ABM) superfamily enzyme
MVVYEVNLSINREIFTDYKSWLDEHILQMLEFPGFLNATILNQTIDSNNSDEQVHLTVQYQLESAEDLQTYFDEYAAKMRSDGVSRFEGRFSATRRIFEVEKMIEAKKYAQNV